MAGNVWEWTEDTWAGKNVNISLLSFQYTGLLIFARLTARPTTVLRNILDLIPRKQFIYKLSFYFCKYFDVFSLKNK